MNTTLRQVFRQLRQNKGFTTITLLTLALCIGATTAIFSTVYSLMLKPLPFEEPEQIVELYTSAEKAGLDRMPANIPFYVDYSENAESYQELALWRSYEAMIGDDDNPSRAQGARITSEIFSILKVKPLMGNFFTKKNSTPGNEKVVILTQSFWQTHFAEQPEVIDEELRIDGETFTIIGIAPRVFEAFDARVQYLIPLAWAPDAVNPQRRYGVGIQLFGRLNPNATIAQADAEAKILEERYVDASPPGVRSFVDRSGMTMNVGGVQEQRVKPVRTTLLLLQGGVAFVLLIGCVNVSNLLLARSNARQSELAIRTALGAGRLTIARQLMLESFVLTSLGALLGLAVAWGALNVTNIYLAKMLPQALPATLDLRVLGFAMVLTVIIGVLIGLIPIFHVWRSNLNQVIQSSSRSASSGQGVRALSSLLVVTQVAVALILLTGAGLLIHSFAKALEVDPGLNPKGVVVGRVALPRSHRADNDAAKQIRDRIIQGMKEIPGVSSAALSFATPFQGGLPINAFTLREDTLPPGSPQPGAFRVRTTPEYLDTMGLRLIEGRFFEEADISAEQPRFVVDESFAKKFFAGKSAVGGQFTFGRPPENPEDWPSIIGVVADVPHNGVEDETGNPFIYQVINGGRPGGFTLFLRSDRPASDTLSAMREKLQSIDPGIVLFDTAPLSESIGSSFDNRRAIMMLLVAFAFLALFLSALGIYGVLAYDVSQRAREIGIRGAIGASSSQVVSMIIKQGLWKAGIGLATGLVGAVLLSRYMTSLLFEVEATDPAVYVSVSLLLLLVAVLASYLPARRAAKIDPMVALRIE
ncbi:ABC transporter permease [Pelagicoccus mobilis]|uniref:ABC transporter permease n=1 Tax=Pelagicoccus mobilis TaxID=415221 RepID=A0A934VRJ7_9BACT|nr:ABC transporter permease [Pelagicoccus mobilis]MBK1877579.1 ABC transporter permease [Pelagicoccus mobilis]